MIEYICIDIENNNSNRYKRKAGHFLYDAIVAIGLKNKYEVKAYYLYPDGIRDLLIDEDMIVGFNIKHDLLFLWHLNGIQEFFKRGGKLWDCQYVEYLLTNFKVKYPSLRDIAVQKYGCAERIKWIDEFLFNVPIKERVYQQVSDCPFDKVILDVSGDVCDTEKIFLKQYQECKERGLLPLVEIQMNTLLYLIETEYNGFKIDQQVLQKNRQEINDELCLLQEKLSLFVNKYWNTSVLGEFNYRSTQHLKLLFFGGDIKVKVKVEDGVYKGGQKQGQIKYKNTEIIHTIKGLGLNPQGHWMTEKGNVSIDEQVLQEIINLLEFVDERTKI